MGSPSLSPQPQGFHDPGTRTGHTHDGVLVFQRRCVVSPCSAPGGKVARPAWLQLGGSHGARDALSPPLALPGTCVCAQGSRGFLPWKRSRQLRATGRGVAWGPPPGPARPCLSHRARTGPLELCSRKAKLVLPLLVQKGRVGEPPAPPDKGLHPPGDRVQGPAWTAYSGRAAPLLGGPGRPSVALDEAVS